MSRRPLHKNAAHKKACAAAPAIIAAGALMGVTTKFAGSVDLTLPAGMDIPEGSIDLNLTEAGSVVLTLPAGMDIPEGSIDLNLTEAGFVESTLITGAPLSGVSNLPRDANRVEPGGLRVNTTRAGSVRANGAIKDVDTSYAGSAKISFTGAVRDGKKGATKGRIIYLPLAMLAGGVAVVYGFSR